MYCSAAGITGQTGLGNAMLLRMAEQHEQQEHLIDPGLYAAYEAIGAAAFGIFFPRKLRGRAEAITKAKDPELRVGVVVLGQPQMMPHYTGQDRNKIVRGYRKGVVEDITRHTLPALERQSISSAVTVALMPSSTTEDERLRMKGVEVIKLDPNTNYADALNIGAAALVDRADVMALTVAGAQYATKQALKAAAVCLQDSKVMQVQGLRLPGRHAFPNEINRFGLAALDRLHPRLIPGEPLQNMPIDHAAFWRVADVLKRKFDPTYGNGGADVAWGAQLAPGQQLLEVAASVNYGQWLDGRDIKRMQQDWTHTFSGPNDHVNAATIGSPFDPMDALKSGRSRR